MDNRIMAFFLFILIKEYAEAISKIVDYVQGPAGWQRDFTSIFIKIVELNKREPIRCRPLKDHRAMAGQAQKSLFPAYIC